MRRLALICAGALAGALLTGCDACFPHDLAYEPVVTPQVAATPTTPAPACAPEVSVVRHLPNGDRDCATLEVRKSAPGQICPGSAFSYRIDLTNLTQGRLENLVVQETLPDGFELIGASAGATRTGNTIEWRVGSLDPQATRSLTVRGTATSNVTMMGCTQITYAMQAICLDIPVSAASPTPQDWVPVPEKPLPPCEPARPQSPASPTTTDQMKSRPSQPDRMRSQVSPSPRTADQPTAAANGRLVINISAPPRQVAGHNVVYVIHVANPGQTAVSDVTVTSVLPPGARFMEASGGGRRSNGTVTWNLDQVDAGQTAELALVIKADQPGTLRTSATARGRFGAAAGEAVTVIESSSSATAAPGQIQDNQDR